MTLYVPFRVPRTPIKELGAHIRNIHALFCPYGLSCWKMEHSYGLHGSRVPQNPKPYSPSKVDRIWLWVYYNKIPIYPIFYLLNKIPIYPIFYLLKGTIDTEHLRPWSKDAPAR